MILYRPVGVKELELVSKTGVFPPRLPGQPIFYPVLNLEYARKIAKEWNTIDPNSGYKGFVLQFEIEDEYIHKFQTHQVGGTGILEYWIPSEELEEFNRHILAPPKVIEAWGNVGYHVTSIPKGEFGEFSKILEEALELQDAIFQKSEIMELLELADLYGAIEAYLTRKHHKSMEDLKIMSSITKRAFENGHRN